MTGQIQHLLRLCPLVVAMLVGCASTVELRDGTSVDGYLVGSTPEGIYIETKSGQTSHYDGNAVEGINYGSDLALTFFAVAAIGSSSRLASKDVESLDDAALEGGTILVSGTLAAIFAYYYGRERGAVRAYGKPIKEIYY